MDPMESIKATFFQECEELLEDLEVGLLAMEQGEGDSETINAVFRAVHSVKGGAGAFGLEDLVGFAHVFETSLELMRSGELTPNPDSVAVLLRAADILSDLVSAAQGGPEVDSERRAESLKEVEALTRTGDATDAGADEDDAPTPADDGDIEGLDFSPATISLDFDDDDDGPEEGDTGTTWLVEIKPRSEMYTKANDAALLLRELETLGDCETRVNYDQLPEFDAIEPEGSFLTWSVKLRGSVSRDDIEEVFEFVEGDCDVTISEAGDDDTASASGLIDIADVLAQVDAAAGDSAPVEAAEIEAPATGEAESSNDAPTAEVHKLEPAKKSETAQSEPTKKSTPQKNVVVNTVPAPTIRVDLDRVDRLIDLVGELVINQAMLAERVSNNVGDGDDALVSMALDDLEQLTREIQDSCMAIRAQPVKSVFQRMPRLVRETAAMVHKKVRLVTEGEGTEVDKTVIEKLTEPLTHMVRNAIDHGLETTEERIAAGKPEEGVVRLAALHRSGRIVLEISDDGKGINRERVYAKAVEKGVIDADAKLTNEEIDNLIFAPGFSTAEAVTDVSGRGVGMDVVKRSIQALGGRLSITSTPGQGSVFTMSLPLTLAVLDGMVIRCGDQTLVVPLTAIIESLKPVQNDIKRLGTEGVVLQVRERYVPLVDIGKRLGYRSTNLDPMKGVVILVETEGGGKAALLVDELSGQRQVVIKSLEQNYKQVEGIAAATIMGDGRVALILDVDAIVANNHLKQTQNVPQLAKAS